MSAAQKPLRLSEETVEALADQVAERVADRLREDGTADTLVSAAEIARRFGVSRDYVYDHAGELGAVRLGGGRRAPLRFDPKAVADRLLTAPPSPQPPAHPENDRTQHRRLKSTRGMPLLPIRVTGEPGRDPPTRL